MTREEVIAMAREAGIEWDLVDEDEGQIWYITAGCLERFAALIAAAEREACARVCDGKVDAEYATGKVDHNEMAWTYACAAAIRARGNDD